MKKQDDLARLVREAFSADSEEFRPCAFFDKRLDCIRIITKDCSVLEERLSDRLTILQNLYDPEPGRPECVGFTLKGALHLCHEYGWDKTTPIAIGNLLDAILKSFPDEGVRVFIQFVAKRLVAEGNIEQVDMSNFTLQPA